MKCMQVNGIKIDKEIRFKVVYNEIEYVFIFMPYTSFIEYQFKLLNSDIIRDCGAVVVYSSMANNSIEVYYIKIFISLIYFAYRIQVEDRRKELYFATERGYYNNISEEDLEEEYKKRESPVTKNWNIRGFWNQNRIENIHWSIKLGKNEISCDDFESYLSRGYGNDLDDSYYKRKIFVPDEQEINIDNNFLKKAECLNSMINSGDKIGNKLKSAMRLYYEIFMINMNMNLSIVTLATILETLLLDKDEDNQRKKVSIRSACIICDGMEVEWKRYIGDTVYFFYNYRNAIVHDGKSYLDFEEVALNNIVENMKHIVFEIIHYYFTNQLEDINDIKQLVIKNKEIDGLENAFDYFSPNSGKEYKILLPES